jgi:hypothetical protein
MMRAKSWTFLVLATLVALTPLAYASPPDPSWIRGVYDDDDFDDVVIFLTSGGVAVEPFPLENSHPAQIALAEVTQGDDASWSAPTFSSNPPRAPPAP